MNDLNRRFAELCGIPWHEKIFPECGVSNPNFIADSRLVLREMIYRPDWAQFLGSLDMPHTSMYWAEKYILDITGLLVKAAIEFLEKEKT